MLLDTTTLGTLGRGKVHLHSLALWEAGQHGVFTQMSWDFSQQLWPRCFPVTLASDPEWGKVGISKPAFFTTDLLQEPTQLLEQNNPLEWEVGEEGF